MFAAVAGVSAVITAGFGWLELLLAWSVCGLLRLILPKGFGEIGKSSAVLLIAGGIVLAAATAFAAEDAFPEDTTFPFVSLGVMALLWRGMIGRKTALKNVGNVLGMILLPLLAAVILFGLSDVRWSNQIPDGVNWEQVWIAVAVTSPWWCVEKERDGQWKWFFLCSGVCIGMSLLTRGILGAALTAQTPQPLYRAVQTIHILGVLQRFEALLAGAVLLGSFGMLLVAGEMMRRGMECLAVRKKKNWRMGLAVGISFALEFAIRCRLNMVSDRIMTVFWGLVPIFALWMVLIEKKKEN